jgi:hypothetical protein
VQPTVEERRRMTDDSQHPDQAPSGPPAAVVVADHRIVQGDAEAPERAGERLRCGERVAAVGRHPRPGQIALEVDEDGSRDVRPLK